MRAANRNQADNLSFGAVPEFRTCYLSIQILHTGWDVAGLKRSSPTASISCVVGVNATGIRKPVPTAGPSCAVGAHTTRRSRHSVNALNSMRQRRDDSTPHYGSVDRLLNAALQDEPPSAHWATLPRIYKFRRQRDDWLSTNLQVLNSLALKRHNPFALLEASHNDTSLWESSLFASPPKVCSVDWNAWCETQIATFAAAFCRAAKLIKLALVHAVED